MGRKHKRGGFAQKHHGQHRGQHSGQGAMMKGRSAPYLRKETVVLTDTIRVPSNSNLNGDQIVRLGPNGLRFYGAAGDVIPQSLQFSTFGRLYEFYQVDGFSCEMRPSKIDFKVNANGDNVSVTNQPTFSCLDPENTFPNSPSSILAYNASKTVSPLCPHKNTMGNYKALSLQKQEKTILSTGNGVIASVEKYADEAGFVTYILNPCDGQTVDVLAWMDFTITYTFSGLKRPGATLATQLLLDPKSQEEKKTTSEAKELPREVIEEGRRPQMAEGRAFLDPQEEALERQLEQIRAKQANPRIIGRGNSNGT